jgi:hypothetical protein
MVTENGERHQRMTYLMMEKDCSDVIEMSCDCENAFLCLIIPPFDFVIIPSRYKQWLIRVKCDASHWSFMLFELVNKTTNPIVPELYSTRVQTC